MGKRATRVCSARMTGLSRQLGHHASNALLLLRLVKFTGFETSDTF